MMNEIILNTDTGELRVEKKEPFCGCNDSMDLIEKNNILMMKIFGLETEIKKLKGE